MIEEAKETTASIRTLEQHANGFPPEVVAVNVMSENSDGINALFQLAELEYPPAIVLYSDRNEEMQLTFYECIARDLGLNIVSILPVPPDQTNDGADL